MGTVLTAQFVEDIQHALLRGLPVTDHLNQVDQVTLPGLLEFGCLRWAAPRDIPDLPSAVSRTSLGRVLSAISSPLGLRADGNPKQPVRNIDIMPAEFMVIANEAFLTGQDWQLFLARFSRSAEAAGLPRREAAALAASMQEIADNVVIHSDSPVPGLAGYHVTPDYAQYCVADVGMGVLSSLRTCPTYASLQSHREAIRLALRDGVSRFGPHDGGFGLGFVFKALVAHWGELRFRSGEACLTMSGTDLNADLGIEHFPPALPGFQVSVTCRMRPPAG